MLRTDNPVSMELSVNPPALMIGMDELGITAENTPYGIACLMMDDEVIASGEIRDGVCNLTFAPMSNVGTATLTVMGYNKVTEVIDVTVNPAEGAFLSANASAPIFAPVNQETAFSLNFKNVGADPTSGTTTVSLSCNDSRLTILNGTAEFGVLAADATIALEDAFSFIIAEGTEDGTSFQINIAMTCGSNVWNGKVFVTATQAILKFAGIEWANAFIPGETLSIVAKFNNVGHYKATNAIATITSSNPYVPLLNDSYEIGTIDPEGTAFGLFEIKIDENCPSSEAIELNFGLTADGNLTADGTVTLRNLCNVIFELRDSYGDGWNDNYLVVNFSDGAPSQNLTIENGYTSTKTLQIGNGITVTLRWIAAYYATECSFTIKYEDGTEILSIPQNTSNLNNSWSRQFTCDCEASTPQIVTIAPVENLQYNVEPATITLTWIAPEGATGYIVSRNGVEIGRTTEATFIDEVMMEGEYTYCVVAEYSNGNSLPQCVLVRAEWGIEENEANFAVYPNPVSGTLYINSGNAEYGYEMFNGMGQVVAKGNGQGTMEINVNGMAKGVYFLRLTTGTQVRMEKVVVE